MKILITKATYIKHILCARHCAKDFIHQLCVTGIINILILQRRKDMATQSSILAGKAPWTEESVGLQSVGSQRVRHDLVTKQQQLFCCKGNGSSKRAHVTCPRSHCRYVADRIEAAI